ncbi:MAG: YlxR family protein, partial [Myxococcales bacterium]|nr:YlxR family protein [Myxococcales bacterium]
VGGAVEHPVQAGLALGGGCRAGEDRGAGRRAGRRWRGRSDQAEGGGGQAGRDREGAAGGGGAGGGGDPGGRGGRGGGGRGSSGGCGGCGGGSGGSRGGGGGNQRGGQGLVPERTCVGCRRTEEQARMVRLVADGAGRIRIDEQRRQPGRGAYLHDDRRCVEDVVKRGGLARSLKRNLVPMAADELWRKVHDAASQGQMIAMEVTKAETE